MFQTVMTRGTLHSALEEHQRTNRPRRRYVLAKQVHEYWDAKQRQSAEKPWSEEAHQLPACRSAR